MKKLLALILLVAVAFGNVDAQMSKKLQKKYDKMYKEKVKELTKEGWKVTGTAKTLEVALMEHYEKLKDENAQELAADVSACQSLNVCKQAALNNALISYSSLAGSYLKGRITSDMNVNQSEADGTEFDKMYAAYERLVSQEVKGVLFESLALVKDNGKSKSYKIFYIVNEDKASKARMKAFEMLQQESKMAQMYGTQISQFVNAGFEVDGVTE